MPAEGYIRFFPGVASLEIAQLAREGRVIETEGGHGPARVRAAKTGSAIGISEASSSVGDLEKAQNNERACTRAAEEQVADSQHAEQDGSLPSMSNTKVFIAAMI